MKDLIVGLLFVSVITIGVSLLLGALGLLFPVVYLLSAVVIVAFLCRPWAVLAWLENGED